MQVQKTMNSADDMAVIQTSDLDLDETEMRIARNQLSAYIETLSEELTEKVSKAQLRKRILGDQAIIRALIPFAINGGLSERVFARIIGDTVEVHAEPLPEREPGWVESIVSHIPGGLSIYDWWYGKTPTVTLPRQREKLKWKPLNVTQPTRFTEPTITHRLPMSAHITTLETPGHLELSSMAKLDTIDVDYSSSEESTSDYEDEAVIEDDGTVIRKPIGASVPETRPVIAEETASDLTADHVPLTTTKTALAAESADTILEEPSDERYVRVSVMEKALAERDDQWDAEVRRQERKYESQKEELKQKIVADSATITTLQRENKDLLQENAKLRQENATLDESNKVLNTDKDTLGQRIDTLVRDIGIERRKVKELEATIAQLKSGATVTTPVTTPVTAPARVRRRVVKAPAHGTVVTTTTTSAAAALKSHPAWMADDRESLTQIICKDHPTISAEGLMEKSIPTLRNQAIHDGHKFDLP